jgi:hypothetical protein
MIWKTFVSQIVIRSRKKAIATALVYGLSLAVRYTSATGEVIEVQPQSSQNTNGAFFSVINDAFRFPYRDWRASTAQPIVFRHGSGPLSSGGCHPECDLSLPAPSKPSCLAP